MATTGTVARNFEVVELCEEAFDLAGFEMKSGYDIRMARRSLDFITLEWANKGHNLWVIDEQYIQETSTGTDLVTPKYYLDKSVASYRVALGTISLFDVVLRINDGTVATQQDYILSRISQPTYSNIPNKLTLGRPLQYWFDRSEIQDISASADQYSTITFWPVPDTDSKYNVKYWRARRMDDVGNVGSNTMQVPDRFMPALAAALAVKVAMKKRAPADKIQMLHAMAEGLYMSAAEEDREKTSARFVPHMGRIG